MYGGPCSLCAGVGTSVVVCGGGRSNAMFVRARMLRFGNGRQRELGVGDCGGAASFLRTMARCSHHCDKGMQVR